MHVYVCVTYVILLLSRLFILKTNNSFSQNMFWWKFNNSLQKKIEIDRLIDREESIKWERKGERYISRKREREIIDRDKKEGERWIDRWKEREGKKIIWCY